MSTSTPSFREFFRYWLRLGFVNFGGPAGQIARLRRELAESRGWMTPEEFDGAREFCGLLPGAPGHLLAVALGWRIFGVRGGVTAGALALLPGAALVLGLSLLAVACGETAMVSGALRGLAGAALALLVRALWREGRRVLTHPVLFGFAAASLLMGYVLHLKFYGVVVGAALMGLWLGQTLPGIFCPGLPPAGPEAQGRPWRRAGRLAVVFVLLWLAAETPELLAGGAGSMLPRILNFYVRAGFFAFGGAYGALAFVSDMALRLDWLGQGELARAFGLAGLAPGPLMLAAQHAGFVTAFGQAAGGVGGPAPLVLGALGGILATFGLFLPGFFIVFATAPHMETVRASRWLRSAVTGISAAVVGAIAKLCLRLGAASLWPQGFAAGGPDTLVLAAFALGVLLLWRLDSRPYLALAACGAAGAAWTLLG
jgi:chromate transporter